MSFGTFLDQVNVWALRGMEEVEELLPLMDKIGCTGHGLVDGSELPEKVKQKL